MTFFVLSVKIPIYAITAKEIYKMARNNELDMSSGSVMKNVIAFSVPLMLSGILQLLFNAADIIVVGKYVGKTALGAVGATGSLINLITVFFISISVGTSVTVAKSYGARDYDRCQDALHTSVALSIIGGLITLVLGTFFSKEALRIMQTPSDIIDSSTLYMKIYFLGAPAFVFYNFGAMALRATGDTKGPLQFLTIAGVVNVILNLVLVIGFDLGVAGVAIATTTSQYVSAVLILISLLENDGFCHLNPKKIRLHKEAALEILKIGVPASIQGVVFSASNVIIQSSVNSFNSSSIVAGNSAAGNVEGFVYTAMNSVHQTTVTMVGQNYGAKKYDRIRKTMLSCSAFVVLVGLVMGGLVLLFPKQIMSIYSSDSEVISNGLIRLHIIMATYFTCGLMEIFVGGLRGLGSSFIPMLVSIFGVCGIRIVWIYTVFAHFHTLQTLYISYPISWCVTAAIQLACYIMYKKRILKNINSPAI